MSHSVRMRKFWQLAGLTIFVMFIAALSVFGIGKLHLPADTDKLLRASAIGLAAVCIIGAFCAMIVLVLLPRREGPPE